MTFSNKIIVVNKTNQKYKESSDNECVRSVEVNEISIDTGNLFEL